MVRAMNSSMPGPMPVRAGLADRAMDRGCSRLAAAMISPVRVLLLPDALDSSSGTVSPTERDRRGWSWLAFQVIGGRPSVMDC